MGKDKLKSSLRVLQIALSKLKVSKLNTEEEEEEEEKGGREAGAASGVGGQRSRSSGWSFSCGQPRTHSFRVTTKNMTTRGDGDGDGDGGRENVYSSFNSLYIVSDLKPHNAQSLFPLVEEEEEKEENEEEEEEEDCCKGVSKRSSVMICDEKGRIFDMLPDADNSFRKFEGGFLEEETSMEMEFTSKSSNYSSDFSSESSRSTDFVAGVVRGLSSERFFFSPGRSNSILEEAKWQQPHKLQVVRDHQLAGRRKIDMPSQTERETEIEIEIETHLDVQDNEIEETRAMDLCSSAIAECHNDNIIHDIFLMDSVAMKMNSRDPYLDFRISMEEMVDAHNLKDWSCLQELLCCYLKLNKKKTHRFIVGAFADLVMNRMATNRTSTPPPPLLGYAPLTD